MKTMTLVEFLRARLKDEEDLARGVTGTPKRTGWQLWTNIQDTTPGGETLGPRGSIEASPSRVLADIEAKRCIIRIIEGRLAEIEGYAVDGGMDDRQPQVSRMFLLALVQPYAGHPDFDPAWRQ